MRIYTRAGDLAFSTFRFPDGQPHFKLETYERDFSSVTIEARITSPADLFEVLLVNDVLRQHGYSEVNLDILYLMGARMDRAISSQEPFTLQTVSRLVNGAGFSRVRILDAHSETALRLIRHSSNVLPYDVVKQVVTTLGAVDIVIPDKGAAARCLDLANYVGRDVIYCQKHREMSTGNLSSFSIEGPWDLVKDGKPKLIIDDICDGGATFLGLAKVLREAGAQKAFLYVTHGIFSKGSLDADLIDWTYTTNSFRDDNSGLARITTIPVNMEKL